MNTLSAIDHIYGFDDGDTLIPGMAIVWVNGETDQGFQQYYNPSTGKVVATDFTKHPALVYPKPYSTKRGEVVVPEEAGQQFYIGNVTDEGGILQDGKVKEIWKDYFELATVTANGKTFPALKIKGNLADKYKSDKTIYYQSSYRDMKVICSQPLPIMASAGDSFKVLVNCVGADGSGDNVLSNDNDWVQFTANLQRAGINVDGAQYQWQRNESGVWKDMTTIANMQEVNGQTLKLYNAGVEGSELFRCLAKYNSQTYVGTAEATDIHDPFYIDIGRSIPTQGVNVGQTVTYNPNVYERSTGELSTGWTFIFSFTDNDGNTVTDVTEKTLTYDNITKHNGIAVRIEARKS